MVGSAAIKQGRSANRKHTYFFFWPQPARVRYERKSTSHKDCIIIIIICTMRQSVSQSIHEHVTMRVSKLALNKL